MIPPINDLNLEGTNTSKGIIVFLLQKLGFVINLKRSQLTPIKDIEFLGLIINSETMTLALPKKKVLDIQKKFVANTNLHPDEISESNPPTNREYYRLHLKIGGTHSLGLLQISKEI